MESSRDIQKGETPLAVAINDEIIGLVVLKDNLKENIREKLARSSCYRNNYYYDYR